ncbi:MAG TPA: 2'-5' RNA ligase family protein [Burkholderiales bacterium]|nr:2'-5' RNA ligase family protein [Burkholderiales bacterium]
MLAAICIPRFPEEAAFWLQALRARHDPKYARLVPPHVTLVFPTDALPPARFVAHVISSVRAVKSGQVEFLWAREFADEGAHEHLVYLLPGIGADMFLQLHAKLYSGPLDARARCASAYLPHITLGRFSSADAAAAVAAGINAAANRITGAVEAVEIVQVGDELVRAVHTEPLRAG